MLDERIPHSKEVWSLIELVVKQADEKENTLDSYISGPILPTITSDITEIIPFLKTLPKEKLCSVETNLYRSLCNIKAMLYGEEDLSNQRYIMSKHPYPI